MIEIDFNLSTQLCIALLHSLWQSAGLVTLAWLVSKFFPGREYARVHYAIYTSALVVGLIAFPVTYLWMPAIHHDSVFVGASTLVHENSLELHYQQSTKGTPASGASHSGELPVNRLAQSLVPSATGELAISPTRKLPGTKLSWQGLIPWLATAYLAGVALMLLRLVWNMAQTQRLRAGAQQVDLAPINQLLTKLSQKSPLRQLPAIMQSSRVMMPVVIGWFKPTIILPTAAITGLSIGDIEMVLAHELAHVNRYDVWVNSLQRLAESLLFFNPAIWYLSRQVSRLREHCCDDDACSAVSVSETAPQIRYATALLNVVALHGQYNEPQLIALSISGRSPSELRQRISRLLDEPLPQSSGTLRALAILAALSTLAWTLSPLPESDAQIQEPTQAERQQYSQASANRAVASARDRTFGNHVSRISFQQTYQQAEVPEMQKHDNDNIESLWKARSTTIPEQQFDRVKIDLTLAWHDNRLLLKSAQTTRPNESFAQTKYWDGSEGWLGESSNGNRHVYRYADMDLLLEHTYPFNYPHWDAAGGRLPWNGPEAILSENEVSPANTNYKFVGTETIDGINCVVFDGPQRSEKIWITKDSGLVKAVSRFYARNTQEANWLQQMTQLTGVTFDNETAWAKWYKSQSKESLAKLTAQLAAASWPEATPGNLIVFSDYEEILPGVNWPRKADRITVHPAGSNAFKYTFGQVTVDQISSIDSEKSLAIEVSALEALPQPGMSVTDLRGAASVDYQWTADFSEESVEQLLNARLAELKAEEESIRKINDAPINSVADAIEILTEGPDLEPVGIWARSIKYLTDHPAEALPALIIALDKEKRDHPLRKLVFAIRAVGDKRAVPALIRAFPRTLLPGASDFGLSIDDEDLGPFLQMHDVGRSQRHSRANYEWWFSYGRAINEIIGALKKLTQRNFGEDELVYVSLKGHELQQQEQRRLFLRVASRWATWWEANWSSIIDDSDYAKVNLPNSEAPKPLASRTYALPTAPDNRLVSAGSGGIIASVHDSDEYCFKDFDTGRVAEWPESLAALDRNQLDSPELLEWARREGFDAMGVTHTHEGEESPLYCVLPLGMQVWKMTEKEHRALRDSMTGKIPYPRSSPIKLMVPQRTVPGPRDRHYAGDAFLFITREGTAGVLRMTAQVTETPRGSEGVYSWTSLFENTGVRNGVKIVLHTMSAPASHQPPAE